MCFYFTGTARFTLVKDLDLKKNTMYCAQVLIIKNCGAHLTTVEQEFSLQANDDDDDGGGGDDDSNKKNKKKNKKNTRDDVFVLDVDNNADDDSDNILN